ncbi:RNA-directed DNA polymerase from mobile element jockey [Trichonephila clavipes]|nr:RNA-directed DNA polymerase from mobile element jockey [Trichonephila clavipes]
MPLIYLQLVNDAKADTIFQFGTQISFERYDNSRNKRPNQCWRCQGFSILRKSVISQLNALNAQGLTRLKTIANDEEVDEELLARAFRAALPALRKLSHPDDKACEIFQAYVVLKNGQTKLEPGQNALIANYHLYKDDRVILPRIRTAGGTAIYCKSNFVHSRAPLPGINNEHLDVAIGRLGENISESFVAASKPKFKTAPIKLPLDIRSKIRHRNRVRRFWQRSRDPALKNELRTISNEIASDIRHLSRARWEKTIEELSPETGTLWRRTSFLKKPFHHIPPLKGALGSIAVAPIEKAEVIADSLQKQFEPNTDVENPRFSAHIQRKIQRFLDSPTCMDLEKTSPSEIQGFIKNLKPNKSPGIDLITNRILKNLLTKFIIFIALLFNMLLENCYFPKSWRMAVVIPILKPNSDDSNPQTYRPISLLSSVSKAYEFVILNRQNQHCLARNIIISEQHGFVTKCSTVTQ